MTTFICLSRRLLSLNVPSTLYQNTMVKYNIQQRCLCTSTVMQGLMEFFDEKDNWGAKEVKSGRSWTKDDLRIKSNSDLHKLWYILLKERNMLITMEEECKEQVQLFPSPERLDKVEESMENLEAVVRERNKAYFQLETGEVGERVEETIVGPFGLEVPYKTSEHIVPKHLNDKWLKEHEIDCDKKYIKEFLYKHQEKEAVEKRKAKTRNFNHVIHLMNRFPNLDMEAVKKEFPDVDIEKAKASRKYRPMFQKD